MELTMQRIRNLIIAATVLMFSITSVWVADEPAPGPTDFFDAIKYIELNSDGDVWISFGGHARTRYELFNNFGFSDANDDSFLLTRVVFK